MLFDEKPDCVLVLLFFEAQVKKLEFFQFLKNQTAFKGLFVALISWEERDTALVRINFTELVNVLGFDNPDI